MLGAGCAGYKGRRKTLTSLNKSSLKVWAHNGLESSPWNQIAWIQSHLSLLLLRQVASSLMFFSCPPHRVAVKMKWDCAGKTKLSAGRWGCGVDKTNPTFEEHTV